MFLANKVRSGAESRNVYEKLSAVVDRFLNINLEYLGAIPNDDSIAKAVMRQTPVSIAYPSSAPAKAFREIGESLCKGDTQVNDYGKGLAGLFARLFGSKSRT